MNFVKIKESLGATITVVTVGDTASESVIRKALAIGADKAVRINTNPKDSFELYKVSKDYYETKNLINNPKYEWIYKELKYHLFKWMEESDFGNMNESAMLDSMFNTSMSIPKLNLPKIIMNDAGCLIEPNNVPQ